MESLPVLASLDGSNDDPAAICGFSIRFPQEATSSEAFWKMLLERRCATTNLPPDRINPDGFYQRENRSNTFSAKGGHFLRDDLGAFDAGFFSISPAEAAAMDPMQRWLLETAYTAFENAGIPMESIAGSKMAVFVGSFGWDYLMQMYRDPETLPKYAALGVGLSMLANRLSWFFDLRGPSIGLDAACSSGATALDLACQALQNGTCDTCLVAGCNLTYAPEAYISMANLDFLSPDSRCYSFDGRANGYARGEGFAVLVLKRVSCAIRDGDVVRAVIRATGSNQDGRTPGITQPSRAAQERLIRDTYRKAGLDMAHTRYCEAHGTGTAIGDPREAQAIGAAFRDFRSQEDPLFVGAVKSNIGHLEGASGLAGVIKATLVLEKGVIPPNANFESPNPRIDTQYLKIKFPEKGYKWPAKGLRRASVSSFGYGGANSHIVLDDAYNYMRLRSLLGKHCTKHSSPCPSEQPQDTLKLSNGFKGSYNQSKLLVWSSADKGGIGRIAQAYQVHFRGKALQAKVQTGILDDLAYTLDTRRSHLSWRACAVLNDAAQLVGIESLISDPIRVGPQSPRVGFVFTGQGAQWYGMGRELTVFPSFQAELCRAQVFLQSIGCSWSVTHELFQPEETSRIDQVEQSQTLCTVLQVALINLVRRLGLKPCAVVGHSSGEIAAAYAAEAVTMESAWKLAFIRGLCSAKLLRSEDASYPKGAMMSVALSEGEARRRLQEIESDAVSFGISVACVNSARNVTVSGEDHLVDRLKALLDDEGVFAKKLPVSVAYHSQQMRPISHEYASLIGKLEAPVGEGVPMLSTVTGEAVQPKCLLEPSYWSRNMASVVKFDQAVALMCVKSAKDLTKKVDKSHKLVSVVDHLVEIGPHSSLQSPIRAILQACPRGASIGYASLLKRNRPAMETMMQALGQLHCMGYPLRLRAINEPGADPERSLLVDLPEYPFDHSQKFWHESRLSRNYRLREHTPSELIGTRSNDWIPSDARWRHIIRASEIPWLSHHVVRGIILYPAAGMMAMAVEGARQIDAFREIDTFLLENVAFKAPIQLRSTSEAVEVQIGLRLVGEDPSGRVKRDFFIHTLSDQHWKLNCRGTITVGFSDTSTDGWDQQRAAEEREALVRERASPPESYDSSVESRAMYSYLQQHGLEYGPAFQALRGQRYNATKEAVAEVSLLTPGAFRIDLLGRTESNHPSYFVGRDSPPRLHTIDFRGLQTDGYKSQQPSITAYSTISRVTHRGFFSNGIAIKSDKPGALGLWYEGLEVINTTNTPVAVTLPNPRQFHMSVECRPAVGKLTPQQTQVVLESLHPPSVTRSKLDLELEEIALISLRRLKQSVEVTPVELTKDWKKHYWNWANHHLGHHQDRLTQSPSTLEVNRSLDCLRNRVDGAASGAAIGRIYLEIAANLVALFHDEIHPMEIFVRAEQFKAVYEDLYNTSGTVQACHYLDLLAHQKPGMNILEVGGGTGAGTRRFLKALQSQPGPLPGSLRCARYDFTDVSSAFLAALRKEFERFQSQVKFGALDIQHDFGAQGYGQGEYDVVLAVDVIHLSSDLAEALRNVRQALRPGGKLIMHETFDPSGWTLGFVFGLFPGWWVRSGDKTPLLSPSIGTDQWDELLKATGFTGIEMVLPTNAHGTHHSGWMTASAREDVSMTKQPVQLPGTAIVLDASSPAQCALAQALESPLAKLVGAKPRVLTMDAVASSPAGQDLIICLLNYDPSFLRGLAPRDWKPLKSVIQSSYHQLWVSSGGGRVPSPDIGIIDGLARTLRSEHYRYHVVTLALEPPRAFSDETAPILQVAWEMLSAVDGEHYEQEYVETDKILHTRRLVEANSWKVDVDASVVPYAVSSALLWRHSPFQLSLAAQPFPGQSVYTQTAAPRRAAKYPGD
ncbi:polyketide synthase [Apiospora marii]|uniref:polyketide synthase n=1 Tax=Apiospora marii TaxID=335849 RepID=UPI0031309019